MPPPGLRARLQMLRLALRIARGNLLARLRGEPRDVRLAALEHLRRSAPAGDPGATLAALDDFGRNRRFLMNVGDAKGPLLGALVAGLPAGARVLELGAFVGYSATLIASRLPADASLVSLEKHPVAAQVAQSVVAHAGLADRVQVRCGDSAALIPGLQGPFDLVFIDHWKDLYLRDLRALEDHGLLRAGSVVVADNVGPLFGAHDYLAHVRGSGRYDSRYHVSTLEYSDIEDGVEVSVYRPPSR